MFFLLPFPHTLIQRAEVPLDRAVVILLASCFFVLLTMYCFEFVIKLYFQIALNLFCVDPSIEFLGPILDQFHTCFGKTCVGEI